MGKLRCFRINLSSEDAVFCPGETIHGYCEVEVADGELSLKTLTITLRGVSKVHWTESRNVGARLGPYTQHFMSGDQYLREKKVLAQPRMGADRVTLRPGKYEFPFTFVLPTGTMPSSFDGKYGSTRYWFRAEINRLRLKSDKTKRTITFINPLNISLPEYQEPVESAADKTLCCGFCTGGLVSITAHTDKAGYCSGDTIVLSAQFENFTRRRLHPSAALYQRQYFYANDRQKTRTVRLVKFSGPRLSSKCNSSWRNEQLLIPNVTPTMINCSILKVVYFVKISLRIPGSMKLSTILPITIGSNRVSNPGISGHLLAPPPYQALEDLTDLPAYDYSTSDDDDDYLQPPCSRSHTPPPCYSDIFDSDSDDEDEEDNEGMGSTADDATSDASHVSSHTSQHTVTADPGVGTEVVVTTL